jgi:hypothetical protein
MVNGEQLRRQRVIGLPFTVRPLPNALRFVRGSQSSLTVIKERLKIKNLDPGEAQ